MRFAREATQTLGVPARSRAIVLPAGELGRSVEAAEVGGDVGVAGQAEDVFEDAAAFSYRPAQLPVAPGGSGDAKRPGRVAAGDGVVDRDAQVGAFLFEPLGAFVFVFLIEPVERSWVPAPQDQASVVVGEACEPLCVALLELILLA